MFIDELDNLFHSLKLYDNNIYYIIAGDLNARRKVWGDRSNNHRGRYLGQWENNFDCNFKLRIITPAFPSFKPAQTYLDICLIDSRLKLINDIGEKAASLPYDSDHTVLSLFFELPNDSVPVGNADYNNHRYNFKTTNWDRFTKKL